MAAPGEGKNTFASADRVLPPGKRLLLEAKLESLQKKKAELSKKTEALQRIERFQQLRKRLLNDLYAFSVECMGFKDLYAPLHEELCQTIANSDIDKQLILIPRGHFKTTLISICYPVWLLLRNPNETIMLVSSTAGKACENLEEIVERIRQDEFQTLFGDIIGPPETWVRKRQDQIRIPRKGSATGPSIFCLGVDSAEVGRHCSVALIDDMVGQEEVNSLAAREKVWQWFGRQMAVINPKAQIRVLGTRWHSDDPYSRIVNFPDWHKTVRKYKENGKFIFPTRFNDDVIQGIRQIMDDYHFSCFYLNDPVGEGQCPFEVNKFTWIDYPYDREDCNSAAWTYILVDPASTIEDYSCPSGFIVGDAVSTRHGKKFVVREAILEKLTPDQIIEKIFSLVDKFSPMSVVVESEAQQAILHSWMRREMLRRKLSFRVEEVKSPRNVKKFSRVVGLQPYLHNGDIVFVKDLPGKREVIEQFSTYPKGKQDDLVLALSFALPSVKYPPKFSRSDKQKSVPIRSRLLDEMNERHRRAVRQATRRRGVQLV